MPVNVTVDLTQRSRPISPFILGTSCEAGDAYLIFTPQHTDNGRRAEGWWDPSAQRPVSSAVSLAKEAGISALRYPGGCLGHGFYWKKTIGPVEDRKDFAFGVMEYMELCRRIGAEPLMTTGDYSATPQDNQDLAEFLNAPADAAHPWARKRAEYGHPAPYKVRFFELGNETEHGNHDLKPSRKWTSSDYVAWAGESIRRIHAVDPSAKVGVHLGTTFPNVDDPWNLAVLNGLGKSADFLILHTYAVNWYREATEKEGYGPAIMQACLASNAQFETNLGLYRKLIRRVTGRDIPIAVTEYNAGMVQETPEPYRFSYGAALFCADYLRTLANPGSGVFMANYWQFLNGYWGMVQGSDKQGYRRLPAFFLYRLWAKHFGSRWLSATVQAPGIDFAGQSGTAAMPARGSNADMAERPLASSLFGSNDWVNSTDPRLKTDRSPDRIYSATIPPTSGEVHVLFAALPGPPGASYRVSFDARSSGDLRGSRLGLSLVDVRGWEPYHSGTAIEGVESAAAWTKFTGRFDTLPDCRGLLLVWRVIPGNRTMSGTMEIRNLTVTPVELSSWLISVDFVWGLTLRTFVITPWTLLVWPSWVPRF